VKLQIRPANATTCTYVERGRACHDGAVGELRAHLMWRGQPWPMCEHHLQPEMHPPDLHDKLYRWTIARGKAPAQ
jgi:hypothetical protein